MDDKMSVHPEGLELSMTTHISKCQGMSGITTSRMFMIAAYASKARDLYNDSYQAPDIRNIYFITDMTMGESARILIPILNYLKVKYKEGQFKTQLIIGGLVISFLDRNHISILEGNFYGKDVSSIRVICDTPEIYQQVASSRYPGIVM